MDKVNAIGIIAHDLPPTAQHPTHRPRWDVSTTVGLLLLLFCLLTMRSVRSLLLAQAAVSGPNAAAAGPAIFVQGGLTAHAGELVNIPIAFENHGVHVSSLSFSLDYDRDCLRFEADDQDGNGLPDAIDFTIPAQFSPSIIVRPDGYRDELHIVVADYRPPFAALPDTVALVNVRLRVICSELLPRTASISFFEQPPVSFSDQNGQDLPGLARGGIVTILTGQADGTPTPLVTRTMIPTAPAGTPTLAATAMPPTSTPWVHLEANGVPNQLTVADTAAVIVIDYTILLPVNDIAFTITLPPQTRFNAATSTVGWQCPANTSSEPCRFPIPSSALLTQMSGRIFFALTLDWLVLPIPTQLEFTLAAVSSSQATTPAIGLILPVLLVRQTQLPDSIDLELQADIAELVIQSSDSLSGSLSDFQGPPTYQITYQLTYTNRSTLDLAAVDFHLLLPNVTRFQSTIGTMLVWECAGQNQEQPLCTATLAELASGARRRETFVLQVTGIDQLRTRNALALVAYVTSAERVLGNVSSVVPVRYTVVETQNARVFLPLVMTASQP